MYVMQHVAAVLARKRQEDVQKAKKLQQIEEDRKMAEELHKQRLEREVHLQIHVQYLFLCTILPESIHKRVLSMSITKEYALFRGNVVKFVSSSIALPTCTCTVYIH